MKSKSTLLPALLVILVQLFSGVGAVAQHQQESSAVEKPGVSTTKEKSTFTIKHSFLAVGKQITAVIVNESGDVEWNLGEKLISDACGVQRLPSGNTVVTSYRTKGKQVKLFEVTPEKKVVWKFDGFESGIHHFQILTTIGEKISPAMK